MPSFHYRTRAPKTLTSEEAKKVLAVTGEHVKGVRDHILISLALGTGLREVELVALDWEHVTNAKGGIRERVALPRWKGQGKAPKRAARAPEPPPSVILPPDCRRKLEAWRRSLGRPTGPLFVSRDEGARLSTRMVRELWKRWQVRAGLERHLPFHSLRHTYCRAMLKAAGNNLVVVQRAARHASIATTAIYLEPSDEELTAAARRL